MKVNGPCFSLKASGSIGPRLTFSQRKTGQQARFQRPNKDANSVDQNEQREIYKAAVTAWRGLSAAGKKVWNDQAIGRCLTGWNLFMQNYSMSVIQKVCSVSGIDLLTPGDTVLYTVPPGKKFVPISAVYFPTALEGTGNEDEDATILNLTTAEYIFHGFTSLAFLAVGGMNVDTYLNSDTTPAAAGTDIILRVVTGDTGMTTLVITAHLIGYLIDA